MTTKTSKPPLVETTEFDEDWLSQEMEKGKTYGEFLGELFPQMLVDGKHGWQVLAEKPENKHDLDLMLACCKAQIEESSITQCYPAPAYFKRVAIILRKQKDYEREIGIIEFYWALCDRVLDSRRKSNDLMYDEKYSVIQHNALKKDFEHRYSKAQLLLSKQSQKMVDG